MTRVLEHHINEQALDKTMALFWQHGFDHISIGDIVDQTGMNRATIYKYFGNKEGLYHRVLQHYFQKVSCEFLKPLKQSQQQPMAAIKDFFSQFLTLPDNHSLKRYGCMMIASASQSACATAPIQGLVQDFFNDVHNQLTQLLQQAQRQGICSPSCHCQQTASFLLGQLIGLLCAFQMSINTPWVHEQLMMVNQYLDQLTSRGA